MRNSYIANSSEALNLHNGTQTAIVVAMKVQPKGSDVIERNGKITVFEPDNVFPLIGCYRIGQEVYVRESWYTYTPVIGYRKDNGRPIFDTQTKIGYKADAVVSYMQSPATMPKSAARTRFKIVGREAVRVKDLKGSPKAFEDFCKQFGIKKIPLSKPYGVNKATHAYSLVDMKGSDEFLYENCLRDYYGAFGYYIAQKLGNNTWDNNDYIWYYKIENI